MADSKAQHENLESQPLQITKFDYDINPSDLYVIIDQVLNKDGPSSLVTHHLHSANEFYGRGIAFILKHGFRVERRIYSPRENSNDPEEKKIVQIHCKIEPTSIEIRRPVIYDKVSSEGVALMPIAALTRDKIYSGQLTLNCVITATAYLEDGSVHSTKSETVKNVSICKLPIIKGSMFCHTYDMSKYALMEMHEDPIDPGGYFLIRGEWAIDCVESMPYNWAKIYINEGYDKQRVRCEFISKPGDSYQNSAYVMIIFNNDNTLVVEIYRDKFMNIHIPFFLLFRALGWTSDKKIMDWIIHDYDDSANAELLNYVMLAMKAKYDKTNYANIYEIIAAQTAIVDMLPADQMKYFDLKNKPANYHNARQDVILFFDTHFFPHIGTDEKSRDEKLKFLALLIRKTILVYLGKIAQTDRVSMLNKRINPAGESYAKAFKSFTNHSVITPVKRTMNKAFRAQKMSDVNLASLVMSIRDSEFERLMKQSVVGGKGASMKLGANKSIINRLKSLFITRKNYLNLIATLRQISKPYTDSGIQSTMATEMRKVHMSAACFKDPVHTSPEGESVGINEQMALSAQIAPITSSQSLKVTLREDTDFMICDDWSPKDIARARLARIYVNGEHIGYVKNSLLFARKYRMKRRSLEIHFHTSIYWDAAQDELYFFVDAGRMTRPVLIVYNNHRDKEYFAKSGSSETTDSDSDIVEDEKEEKLTKSSKILEQIRGKAEKEPQFEQGIALTKQDIKLLYAGKKTLIDLVREQKIEYIAPDEQQNCMIAANFKILSENRFNKYKPFTHCDIPEALIGITTLTSPFAAHNQPAKLIYQTSQAKQTCGYYCLNWPYRMDKETFLQPINEMPLVLTKANRYILPNGCNALMGIISNTGFNQEDSLIANEAAIARGLFSGFKFTYEKVELEQNEEFGVSDASKTEGRKSAVYSKLDDRGVIPKGTKIKKDDVLIGMYMSRKKPDSNILYLDQSKVYKDDEEAVVQDVIFGQNEEGSQFCKVGLRKSRNPIIGDKFSSRHGQKGICALMMKESDAPYLEDGRKLEILFNPHGIPSRMTMGQIIEMMVAKVCAEKAAHYDATIFKEFDMEKVADELEKYGYQRHGYDKVMNGLTGEAYDCLIFTGPIFYQRLAKLVLDNEYIIKNPATDAATRQPLDNAGINGGLRVGEMEKWCFAAHGVPMTWTEKSRDHSDGYVEHICRCGKEAIVNCSGSGYYKCKYCGDNADIFAIPNTWSSKLFRHELQSIGVGMRVLPRPYQQNIFDDLDRNFSKIEKYGTLESFSQLTSLFSSSVEVDAAEDT